MGKKIPVIVDMTEDKQEKVNFVCSKIISLLREELKDDNLLKLVVLRTLTGTLEDMLKEVIRG